MPWCDACAKFWTPPSVNPDGTCPSCGRPIATGPIAAKDVDLKKLAGPDTKVPWHFKLLIVALAVYLGWRLVQLVMWIF